MIATAFIAECTYFKYSHIIHILKSQENEPGRKEICVCTSSLDFSFVDSFLEVLQNQILLTNVWILVCYLQRQNLHSCTDLKNIIKNDRKSVDRLHNDRGDKEGVLHILNQGKGRVDQCCQSFLHSCLVAVSTSVAEQAEHFGECAPDFGNA